MYNPAFFIHKGQKSDARFVQPIKEARWALWLTLSLSCRMVGNRLLTYSDIGITGLPHWFEMACLLVPLGIYPAVLGDG